MSLEPSTKFINKYVATQQGGPFELVKGPYPEPDLDEICIRNRAVALNPIDLKSLHYGTKVQGWPAILGIDVSGVVEAVGKDVKDFKVGDPVMSLAGFGGRAGGFQDVTTVPAHFACRKPADWTFEEAASVPICYLVAAATLTQGLGLTLPTFPRPTPASIAKDPDVVQHKLLSPLTPTTASSYPFNLDTPPTTSSTTAPQQEQQPPTTPTEIRSVLVLGGASGVGACTIQLLRTALPDALIISTNSVSHSKTVKEELGASVCVDRSLPFALMAVRIQALTGYNGVDAIVDAVGVVAEGGEEEGKEIFGLLAEDGPRVYSTVVTGAQGRQVTAVPEGVRSKAVVGRMAFLGLHGGKVMRRLGELVEEGSFGLPLEVEVVGNGLEAIEKGLERLAAGVSGTKLVVAL